MKQGKKVLAEELIGCILDFRVSYGDLSQSYQECALPTELCGQLCTKYYFKSIWVNSQENIDFLL
jgi:hypothetical protein